MRFHLEAIHIEIEVESIITKSGWKDTFGTKGETWYNEGEKNACAEVMFT